MYEAGPTGYHLARAFDAVGITCGIAAPSKMIRSSGDRVKTDKRDALYLARLVAVDEYTPVRVPTVEEEAARNLVRTCDDVRREFMAARHRLSKLLLRRGYVYPGKTTWSRDHGAWLRRIRKDGLDHAGAGTLMAFDDAYDDGSACRARRDRLDTVITEHAGHGLVRTHRESPVLPTWHRHPRRIRSGRGNRRLDPIHAYHHRFLPRAGALRALLRVIEDPRRDHPNRELPRPQTPRRIRLAPRLWLHTRRGATRTVGQSPTSGGRPRAQRQHQTPQAAVQLEGPEEKGHDDHRGRRPRTRKLVPGGGQHGRLNSATISPPTAPGNGSSV